MSSVATSLLSPSNFVEFSSNISKNESRAFTELKNLKEKGISVFLQDKSSRFVLAKQDIIARKVDDDLNDPRYSKLEVDDSADIVGKIDNWYSSYKHKLSGVEDDIRSWLVNEQSKPGKLKVFLNPT